MPGTGRKRGEQDEEELEEEDDGDEGDDIDRFEDQNVREGGREVERERDSLELMDPVVPGLWFPGPLVEPSNLQSQPS